MKKQPWILVAVCLLLTSSVVWYLSPSFRTMLRTTANSLSEWTPEAIQKDPVGYSQFVESKLEKDLETLQTSRKMLATQMEKLAKMQSDKSKLLESGKKLADEFAEAVTAGTFPVTVRNAEYTESQLNTQLSLVIAQINGYQSSLDEINKVARTAETELQKLVINIEKTESQKAMLATRREIFRTRATSTEGLAMLSEINAVLEGNEVLFKDNPVATIEEILARSTNVDTTQTASEQQVEAYLQDYTARKSSKKGSEDIVQTKDIPAAPESNE